MARTANRNVPTTTDSGRYGAINRVRTGGPIRIAHRVHSAAFRSLRTGCRLAGSWSGFPYPNWPAGWIP